MYRLLALLLFLFSGCGFNPVYEISSARLADAPSYWTVVVFGLQVEEKWSYPKFGISLDKYDVDTEIVDAGCWRHDQMSASIPNDYAGVKYFAFTVSPGFYAWSEVNAQKLTNDTGYAYFMAEEYKTTYIGDFVYIGSPDSHDSSVRKRGTKSVAVRSSPVRVRNFLSSFGISGKDVVVPEMFDAPRSGGIACWRWI